MTGPTRRRDEPGAEPGVSPWVRHFAALDPCARYEMCAVVSKPPW
jgi:hypothetical protein